MTEVWESWSEFDVAMTGALAALAGLVIVAASVNIERIVKAPNITARLASAIATLVAGVSISALGLFPAIPPAAYGVAVLVAAAVAAVFQVHATRRIFGDAAPENRLRAGKATIGYLPVAAYAVGGVLVLAGAFSAGLAAVAIGSILGICVGVMVSWVALVEVLR